jgi:DUF4097 and DUF4098 domain-containing protein YvlB
MSEIIEKTFNVASPACLNLSNIRGSVEIRPGEASVIHVTATKDDGSGDEKRTEIELSQDMDGTVKVATHFPDGAWSWLVGSFPCKVNYVVQAPRKSFLKINGVSSDTHAEGFEGEFSFQSVSGETNLRELAGPVKVNTVSGDVELSDLAGGLNLKTVSGRVSGKRLRGPVQLSTVSGGVALEESSLTSVEASTVSGNMVYQTALGDGPYHFNSVSGDVELLIPPETRCSAELRAISGKLTSQIPATSISRQNGSQTAVVQGGGAKVLLQSISGNLSMNVAGKG